MGQAADLALPRVKAEEGFRPYPYKDTLGHLTVGYGHNLDSPMAERLASVILQWHLDECEFDCENFSWWKACDPVRQSVLLDMCFNMGLGGLLQFRMFLNAVIEQDWQAAHDEMLKSAWAVQVGQRAQTLAGIMLNGQ